MANFGSELISQYLSEYVAGCTRRGPRELRRLRPRRRRATRGIGTPCFEPFNALEVAHQDAPGR